MPGMHPAQGKVVLFWIEILDTTELNILSNSFELVIPGSNPASEKIVKGLGQTKGECGKIEIFLLFVNFEPQTCHFFSNLTVLNDKVTKSLR